eukprot:m51a1_g11549 hypothetical protein (296) ;mRNA; r:2039-13148
MANAGAWVDIMAGTQAFGPGIVDAAKRSSSSARDISQDKATREALQGLSDERLVAVLGKAIDLDPHGMCDVVDSVAGGLDASTARRQLMMRELSDCDSIDVICMIVEAAGSTALATSLCQHAQLQVQQWSLDIMRDMAQSVSKEIIMKAGVKQAQVGEKQKKMKKSMLDNKKIKVTSKLNVTAIKRKEVSIQDSYKIYSQVKGLITTLYTEDKELCSFSKMQLRALKNTVYKEVSLEFIMCMDCCCTNFFLQDCWKQCYELYKFFHSNIMLVNMSSLQFPDNLRDYIPKLNPLGT